VSTIEMKSFPINTIRNTAAHVLRKMGYSFDDAEIITDTVMYAELRKNNQGIIKIVSGALIPNKNAASIKVKFETPVSASLDGGQRCGMVVVSHAVDKAILKAKKSGICIVGCSNYSSATGALGYWSRKITEAGFIGIVLSQCNEIVAPYGSYEPILGTNPISIGIPTQPRPQILDMATSALAYFGIKLAEENGDTLANDVAYDENGYATTDPTAALRGAIRVFDRSHKGSHLSLMVELLAGALTGASMENKAQSKNWGSLIIVIDPAIVNGDAEEFKKNAMIMCNRIKNAKKLPTNLIDNIKTEEIYLPGERGDEVEEKNVENGIVDFSVEIYNKLLKMLEE
jgi:LDH2 family malate/lactate/ureidoglycolate dehydrogenase